MKILVTGATGFLGRRLVAELAPRHDLRLLVRATAARPLAGTAAPAASPGAATPQGGAAAASPANLGFPAGVEVVAGDVTDAAAFRRAAVGCEVVVHGAALVKILAPAADFDRINVGGLENALQAAAEAAARLVYVSSFMALGPSEGAPGRELDETAARIGPGESGAAGAPGAAAGGAGGGAGTTVAGAAAPPSAPLPWINSYERTKTRADRLARRAIAAGQPVNVVYPAVIYGPGEMTEGNIVVRHLLDLLHRRLPVLIGSPERLWSYVFVDDVARGVARVVDSARPGARYVLGGDNVRLGDFYGAVEELSGVPVPRRRAPDGVAKAVGAVQQGWARLTGGTPALTPDLVEVYRHDWAYSSALAARDLGYTSRPLREGLTTTLAWLRSTGQWRG